METVSYQRSLQKHDAEYLEMSTKLINKNIIDLLSCQLCMN